MRQTSQVTSAAPRTWGYVGSLDLRSAGLNERCAVKSQAAKGPHQNEATTRPRRGGALRGVQLIRSWVASQRTMDRVDEVLGDGSRVETIVSRHC